MASKRESHSVVLLTVSYETVSFWAVRIHSKRAVYMRWNVGVAKIVMRFTCHFAAQRAPSSCRRLWALVVNTICHWVIMWLSHLLLLVHSGVNSVSHTNQEYAKWILLWTKQKVFHRFILAYFLPYNLGICTMQSPRQLYSLLIGVLPQYQQKEITQIHKKCILYHQLWQYFHPKQK